MLFAPVTGTPLHLFSRYSATNSAEYRKVKGRDPPFHSHQKYRIAHLGANWTRRETEQVRAIELLDESQLDVYRSPTRNGWQYRTVGD